MSGMAKYHLVATMLAFLGSISSIISSDTEANWSIRDFFIARCAELFNILLLPISSVVNLRINQQVGIAGSGTF